MPKFVRKNVFDFDANKAEKNVKLFCKKRLTQQSGFFCELFDSSREWKGDNEYGDPSQRNDVTTPAARLLRLWKKSAYNKLREGTTITVRHYNNAELQQNTLVLMSGKSNFKCLSIGSSRYVVVIVVLRYRGVE